MEVITSMNRISATTFLSLYFSSKNGTRLPFHVTGLANNTFHGVFITKFIFIAFLILCIIPLQVQLVTVYDKLYFHFHKHFNATFKKIYCVFQIVIGLYWVARQCRQFYAPELRLKQTIQESSLLLIQTVPPTDECIPVLQTRPILIRLTEPSPILAPATPQTPAPQQDRTT